MKAESDSKKTPAGRSTAAKKETKVAPKKAAAKVAAATKPKSAPKAKGNAKAPGKTAKPGSAEPAKQDEPDVVEEFPFPVVGVCASAGGLEAFQAFLKAMPAKNGAAFVLVQHMDPHHRSTLPEILEKSTSMPLLEVQDGLKLKPDHVYIGVANAVVGFKKGRFNISKPTSAQHRYRALDLFLDGLARSAGSRAIGVVLSGTGSDGTQGLQSVKEHGGITFGQEPDSARYGAMPLNAYRAGNVDFQAKPAEIAKEIVRIASNPLVFPTVDEDIPVGDEAAVSQIFGMLRNATRVDFSGYKSSTIRRRIARRMVLRNAGSLDKYLRYVRAHPEEVAALYKDLLIKVTEFFRNSEAFTALKSALKTRLADRDDSQAVRVWTPGCATGEETYSVAMVLLEVRAELGKSFQIQVFGTDLSEEAVARARDGHYDSTIEGYIEPARIDRFFTQNNGRFRVNKEVREACIFSVHNVVQDPPFSRIDLITCRNLLIYLRGPAQERVLAAFHYALVPDGVLMLGNSESTAGLSDYYDGIDGRQRIYGRKAGTRPIHFTVPPGRMHSELGETLDFGRPAAIPEPSLRIEADKYVLRRHGPPGVVVNENMDILQFRGDTSRFLTPAPGDASLNLLRMARSGLEVDLRAVLHNANRSGNTVRADDLRFLADDEWRALDIELTPLIKENGSPQRYLVLFIEKPIPQTPMPADSDGDAEFVPKDVADHEIKRLREELRDTREHLQAALEETETANEELRTANEEALSSNEELQSTNEELQTAMEELQSTNEELTTVNEEMQNRNRELDTLNSDLENLLESANLPIVFVGNDLRIRRFTGQAEKLLHLIGSDIGRPVGDLQPRIQVENLKGIIQEVVDEVKGQSQDVLGEDDRWYELHVTPYKTSDGSIDGAVVMMVDIDDLHRRLQETDMLVKAGRMVRDASDLPKVTEGVMKVIGQGFDWRSGEVWSKDDNGLFRMETAWQSKVEPTPALRAAASSIKLQEGEGIPGHAWLAGKPTHWTNIQHKKSGFIRFKEAQDDGITSAVALPILGGDEINRVLVFFLERPASPREISAIELLATQLGLAFGRRMAEAEVLAQANHLIALNRELTMFTRVVAHDLGSPIRSARLHLDHVDTTKLVPSQGSKFEEACNILDMVRELLDHLLEFSRVEANGHVPVEVSLSGIAAQLESGLSSVMDATKGRIQVKNDLNFTCDDKILYHVLSNLVSNGLVHGSEQGPVVTVEAAKRDDQVVIEVGDNGKGMNVETLDRLLEPSTGLGTNRTRLGLALSRHLLRRIGGEIAIEAKAGKGTRIQVILPANP